MIIEPNSTFKLMENIPFNSSYSDTIIFNTKGQQQTFFAERTLFTFPKVSYMRQEKRVRIEVPADSIYQCNYCAFQNTAFGNKWFYAFITNINYVSNQVSEISFEIDDFQTWWFDVKLQKCFVEREHVDDDTLGLHTLDEGLPTGEFMVDSVYNVREGVGVCLSALPLPEEAYTPINYEKNNVFTPVKTIGYKEENYGDMVNVIATYNEYPERIASLIMIPDDCIGMGGNVIDSALSTLSVPKKDNLYRYNQGVSTSTYSVKNNKMKCFPFSFLTVDNYNGDIEQMKWEDFNGSTALFEVYKYSTPKPALFITPTNYKNTSNGTMFGVVYDNFPQCPYSIDTFKAWVSSTFKKQVVNAGVQVAMATGAGVIAGLTGNPLAIAGAVSSTINMAKTSFDTGVDYAYKKTHSTSINGSVSDSSVNFGLGYVGFRITQYKANAEMVKMADEFLTRFGYKVMRYKKPELFSREYFNYVKTVECTVTGKAPNNVLAKIRAIFNNGITLWHTYNVGNFDVENSIVGGDE